MLQGSDISRLVIAITVGRVLGNDLVYGDAAPVGNIKIADKLKPGLEALFPGVEYGIATIFLQAAVLGYAAHIAE